MGLAAIFTTTNTMLSALAARTHEVGILLAIGYRPVPIFLSFLFEALVLRTFTAVDDLDAGLALGFDADG